MLSLASTTRSYPHLTYQDIANTILGPDYTVSLVFLGAIRAQRLNQESRNKSYVPNVLSFPLTETAGEIYLTPAQIRREAKVWNLNERDFTCYLFIHGLLHLAGYDHGPKMEGLEEKYFTMFTKHHTHPNKIATR